MHHRKLPSLKRRPDSKKPKRRFILFCEGKNTEPSYFRSLQALCAGSLVSIETIDGAGVPFSVASAAVVKIKEIKSTRRRSKRNSFEKDDEVWAVFDHDNHPRIKEAVDLCNSNTVGVAYSNPCFEIWLILHVEDYNKPDDRHAVQKYLQSIHTAYDASGSKRPNCNDLVRSVAKAEERAKCLLKRRDEEGTPFGRPCTTVGKLTERIREAARLASKPIDLSLRLQCSSANVDDV